MTGDSVPHLRAAGGTAQSVHQNYWQRSTADTWVCGAARAAFWAEAAVMEWIRTVARYAAEIATIGIP